MIRILICMLIWGSIGMSSAVAQVRVTATLDSTQMLIGDQMNLKLEASYPAGVSISNVDLSVLEDTENIEVITTQENWDTTTIAGKTTIRKNIVFTVFESGSHFIPSIPFSFPRNGTVGTIATNELIINVADVVPQAANEAAVDTVGLAPIKPIYRESMTFEDIAPLLLTFLIIALIGGLIYFIYRRFQNKKLPPKKEVIVLDPAHIIAQRKLKALKAQQLWQNGSIKEYQSQLTFIVREYLENRYGTSALESTTYEILKDLEPIQLSEDWKGKLQEMLELADLVKFAKASPPVEAHDRLMGYANNFVEKTKGHIMSVSSSQEVPREITGDEIVSPQIEYATFGERFLAYLIDLILFNVFFLIIWNIFLYFFTEAIYTVLILNLGAFLPDETYAPYILMFFPSLFFYTLLSFFYFALMESKKGHTIGKKLMGIRVEDSKSKNIKILDAIKRILVKLILTVFFFVSYFTFFFSDRKQTIHDMAAKSIVVKKKKKM